MSHVQVYKRYGLSSYVSRVLRKNTGWAKTSLLLPLLLAATATTAFFS